MNPLSQENEKDKECIDKNIERRRGWFEAYEGIAENINRFNRALENINMEDVAHSGKMKNLQTELIMCASEMIKFLEILKFKLYKEVRKRDKKRTLN